MKKKGDGRRSNSRARRPRRRDAGKDAGRAARRGPSARVERPRAGGEPDTHVIKTSTGMAITLDGDLLAVMETLYREVTARRELEASVDQMAGEIQYLIEQMDETERRAYLAESLFLNTVKYENDKLEAYLKRLTRK
jgi:hypothetical protein